MKLSSNHTSKHSLPKNLSQFLRQLIVVCSTLALPANLQTRAVILAQSGSSYDATMNTVSSGTQFQASLNSSAGYAIGTAIGPHSFITCELSHWGGTPWNSVEYAGTIYYVSGYQEITLSPFVGAIFCVYTITGTFPTYATLCRSEVSVGDLITVYGRGEPVLLQYGCSGPAPSDFTPGVRLADDSGLTTKGWQPAADSCDTNIRWGNGISANSDGDTFYWNFNPADTTHQNVPIGVYACAVSVGDSGGGCFDVNGRLGGVNYALQHSCSGYQTQPAPATGTAYSLLPPHYPPLLLFDVNGLYEIGTSTALPNYNRASSGAHRIFPARSAIFAIISPNVHVSANGAGGWSTWNQGYASVATTSATIATTGCPNGSAAPQAVYQTAYYFANSYYYLSFDQYNLLQTESYTVRVHTSAIHFTGAGQVSEDIYVNGSRVMGAWDPFIWGPNQAFTLDFTNIAPDQNNRIEVLIKPSTTAGPAYGNAIASGIEIFLQQ